MGSCPRILRLLSPLDYEGTWSAAIMHFMSNAPSLAGVRPAQRLVIVDNESVKSAEKGALQ